MKSVCGMFGCIRRFVKSDATLRSINGGPQSPPFIFGLQRRPGLAGRQPRIEDYNLRHSVARQIVDAVMSHRARQICAGRDIWFRCTSKQLFGWPNHFVHISRSRNATRGARFVKKRVRLHVFRPRAQVVFHCANEFHVCGCTSHCVHVTSSATTNHFSTDNAIQEILGAQMGR